MKHLRASSFFLAALGLLPGSLWAQATISGTVAIDGDGIPGAAIFLGDREVRSGADGAYSIVDAAAGAGTLVVFAEGFRTETRPVEVPASGTLTEDFELVPDLLYSDTLVVTGTRNPQTKRESSVAITTISEEQMEEREPRSTADLLRAVPGFYVESSGGEVGGNLFARGLPADGSYRYVALMEDGMPVFDATELSFVNADIFVRVDENVQEMEAVRGGNAALFGSNAPGGVINFISKTGSAVPETDLSLTAGTDGLWRVGFNTRGPVTDDWTYSVGGFYRFDEGVRDPGFPASKGGQIKFNVTRLFDQGYFRAYFKYLNDRNTFYLPVPFQAGGDLAFVEGFPFDGTLHTPEGNRVLVPRPNQEGRLELPLEDGQRQDGFTVMGELSIELGNGWLLQNTARYMDLDHSWNAVVPFDLVGAGDFAAGFTGGPFEYSYTNHDEPFSPAPDELLLTAGLWHIEKPLQSFADQFQLSKNLTAGKTSHSFSIGAYLASYEAGNLWFFNDILTDVRSQPRFVDLTIFSVEGEPEFVTENGFRRFGSLFVNADGDVDVAAVFLGDQIQLGDKLRLDLGLRYESNTFREFEELTTTFDLGDPTTPVDDAVSGGTGRRRSAEQTFDELAFSVGVNYLLSDRVALWARGGTGYKMPILDNYLFGGDDLEAEDLLQLEVGTRIGTPTFGLNASAYFLSIENFPSQDVRVDPVTGETVFVTDFVGQAETTGLEAELVAQPVRGLHVSASATLQQPEYTDFIEGTEDLSGNRVRRIPEVVVDLTIGYRWSKASVSGNWNYYGARWANSANTISLPSYDLVTFHLGWDLSTTATVSLGVLNAFNSKGLTEGNPRLDETGDPTADVFLARPVLPRRATLTFDFKF
ncbi:MAG TPA: TonB-dependent receptor [Thermoanaerobaculia bacterium]